MKIRTDADDSSHRRYYCYYCDQDVTPSGDMNSWGWLDCYSCPVHVRFILTGSLHCPEVGYVQFTCNDAHIELNLFDSKTILLDKDWITSILQLEHLIDANPDNCEEWVKKLMKLKVFS